MSVIAPPSIVGIVCWPVSMLNLPDDTRLVCLRLSLDGKSIEARVELIEERPMRVSGGVA